MSLFASAARKIRGFWFLNSSERLKVKGKRNVYDVADNVARTSTATSPAVAALIEYSYSISLNLAPPIFLQFPPSIQLSQKITVSLGVVLSRAPFLTFSFSRSFVSVSLFFVHTLFFVLSTHHSIRRRWMHLLLHC